MAEAVCVPPPEIDGVWQKVEPILVHALSQGSDHSLEQIRGGLISGGMLLWLAWDGREILAAVVTQLVLGANPVEKRCDVLTIGGKQLPQWIGLITKIEAYAIAEGCAAFRVTSRRKAWKRLLPDFQEPFVILEKRL